MTLMLIRLPAHPQKAQASFLGVGFLSWLHRLWHYRVDAMPLQDAPEAEGVSQMSTEE